MRSRYQIVDVVFTPLKNHIRYEVASPLHCTRMDDGVRNRGTYRWDDLQWIHVFGSTAAALRFIARGRVLRRRMRLATLGYEHCDFALHPASASGKPRRVAARKRHG